MRFTVVLALCAGCYNPHFGNQGFYCHENDSPACPDGQYCVNGQCRNSPGGIVLDGGVVRDQDFGGNEPADLSGGGNGNLDFSTGGNPNPDLSMPQSGLNGCHGLIHCLVACTTTTCENNCKANATSNASTLEMSAVGCGQNYCVNYAFECMDNGSGTLVDGPLSPPSCNQCLNDALANLTGSACSSPSSPDCNPPMCAQPVSACVNDLP